MVLMSRVATATTRSRPTSAISTRRSSARRGRRRPEILASDDKRIRVFHRLHAGDGRLLATGEQMLLHVDMKAGRACPAAGAVLARLAPLAEAARALPWPAEAGRAVGDGR